jgi:hypothetical protein
MMSGICDIPGHSLRKGAVVSILSTLGPCDCGPGEASCGPGGFPDRLGPCRSNPLRRSDAGRSAERALCWGGWTLGAVPAARGAPRGRQPWERGRLRAEPRAGRAAPRRRARAPWDLDARVRGRRMLRGPPACASAQNPVPQLAWPSRRERARAGFAGPDLPRAPVGANGAFGFCGRSESSAAVARCRRQRRHPNLSWACWAQNAQLLDWSIGRTGQTGLTACPVALWR